VCDALKQRDQPLSAPKQAAIVGSLAVGATVVTIENAAGEYRFRQVGLRRRYGPC
jgi:hypothetical protein